MTTASLMTHADIAHLARDIRITYRRASVARYDVPRALMSGRYQSWGERLNRLVFASRSWQGLETIERRAARVIADRIVRTSVFEANHS